MRNIFLVGVASAAIIMPGAAFAQSSGSIDAEEGTEVVVTGSRTDNGIQGVVLPETSKAKGVLTDEFIRQQAQGVAVNEVINQLPGVSTSGNDAYGSASGSSSNMVIRGFDSTRISQTFDGVPVNDSGGYAIYTQQQLDSELISQVNVNLGSTDVDSPTAAASGSTVNYRTRLPHENFGVQVVGSVGDYDFFRMFGVVDTGSFTSFGTRAFLAASTTSNVSPFNSRARVYKEQYNARIYQPLGDNGDFLSIAGHFNKGRNNFQGSVPLRTDTSIGTPPITRVVGPNANNRFPITRDEREYTVAPCTTTVAARPGLVDAASSCGSIFDERLNPGDTGNIRASSKFTLSDQLTLYFDPSYQYVKANGGGTAVAQEGRRDVNPAGGTANCATTPNGAQVSCQVGYIGGTPYFGRDLNGDGDTLDAVRFATPSQTNTHRLGLITSLRYEINDEHSIRLAYTYDRAYHRQTGEIGRLLGNGQQADPFPADNPLLDVNGRVLQKRDRKSYAILHQVAGEYIGDFFSNALRVNLGLRAPFLRRNLTNNCATSSAGGFVECFTDDATALAAYLTNAPQQTVPGVGTFSIQGPQNRVFNYKRLLPNAGFTFNLSPQAAIFGNYSKGIQAPGTDNLYNAFYFPVTAAQANPDPETTDNFDLGVRYNSGKFQAQVSGWYTIYTNRLASSYDPELERSVYRNLGKVTKWGIDGSVAYAPIRELSIYAFGSYLKSRIKDDVVIGRTTAAGPLGPIGTPIYAPTAGKSEAGAPTFSIGGGFNAILGPVEIGGTVKHTGPRFVYDTNEPVRAFAQVNGVPTQFVVFPNKTPAYTIVNLNVKLGLEWAGLNDKTYFKFNAMNLFDELWVGGLQQNLNQGPVYSADGATITGYSNAPNASIGFPRTFMASLIVGL
ncbi:TonB-dependent receptor [Sphingomonas koreensis]